MTRSSVVLPAPFGPTMPIRSPRVASRRTIRATSGPPGWPTTRSSRRRTTSPERGAGVPRARSRRSDGPERGVSIRSRRARRASCSCILPCLRWLRYVCTSACSFAISSVPCLGLPAQAGVALLALAGVRGVVAPEGGEAPVAELPDPGHGRVQEGPIVGGDDERAAAAPDGLLQPLDRREVQVVGGLVEEEQVQVGDQEARQRGPRLLPARELLRRARDLLRA